MDINTKIHGWSIKDGDYIRDPKDKYTKEENEKVLAKPKSALYSIGLFVAIGSFIGLSRFVHNVFGGK